MSGLEILIPIIFEAIGSTAAVVGTAATAIGATVFSGAAAAVAGVGLTGALASIATGALGSAVIGAAVGGIGSLVTGGDFLDGVKNGAIMGGITGGIGGALSGFASAPLSSMGGDVASSLTAGEAGQTMSMAAADSAAGIGAGTGAPSAFTGFNTGVGAAANTGLSGGDVARLGSAANGAAGVAAPNIAQDVSIGAIDAGLPTLGADAGAGAGSGAGSGFGGFFNRNADLIGGTLNGIGKSLSGDTAGAVAEANNEGALERQNDQQKFFTDNYNIKDGLLPPTSAGPARPTPASNFADNQGQGRIGTGQWEYKFDPFKHALVRVPIGT